VSPALAMPGIRAVYTADDAPDHLAGWVLREQSLFAKEFVRYEGEPIAMIVADSLHEAKEALREIGLEIDPQPAVGDIESALAEGTRLVHPEWESYEVAGPEEYPRSGNVAAETISDVDPEAFAKAFGEALEVFGYSMGWRDLGWDARGFPFTRFRRISPGARASTALSPIGEVVKAFNGGQIHRYEDVVADPVAQIRRLFEALDLPVDEPMLRFAGSLSSRVSKVAVDAPRPDKWRDEHPEEVAEVLPLLAPMQELLGYPTGMA